MMRMCHRNMHRDAHGSEAEPCARASNGWKGGRYCGCGVLLCRNAFQNHFRPRMIHRHRTGLDCFGVSKANLMVPANMWRTAISIGVHYVKNFDAPGSICDSLHGNSHEEPQLEDHARVGVGPHPIVCRTITEAALAVLDVLSSMFDVALIALCIAHVLHASVSRVIDV